MVNALLVEDDSEVANSLKTSLAEVGYEVTHVATAAPALSLLGQLRPDVVLLDLGLPDMDGSTLVQILRAVSDVPIVVLTARAQDEEVVRLLDLGADDYLVKPFSIIQLDARIRAVLRRTSTSSTGDLRIGEIRIDPARREVSLAGQRIVLRRREFDVLLVLARNPGAIVTRRQLAREVWSEDMVDDLDARIDVHISAIRSALGESGNSPRYLHTVRGVGLRLNTPEGRP